MVSEIGPRHWMGRQAAAAAVVNNEHPHGTLNDCYRHAKTGSEYCMAGLASAMGESF